MGQYLNTLGNNHLSIGICARCSRKFPIDDLMSDPNSPGLRVCRDDVDDYDPYRLPPRELEDITIEYARPDDPIITTSVAPGSSAWPVSNFPDDNTPSPQLPITGNST